MDMREVGLAAHADQAQGLAGLDAIAGGHPHAALAKVAVLRLPAVDMAQQHAVAAVAVGEIVHEPALRRLIGHAVAHALHHAGGGGQHRHAGRHALRVGNREVGAVVAVGAQRAAAMVGEVGAGVVIHQAHEPAVGAGRAGERQTELQGGQRYCREPEQRRCDCRCELCQALFRLLAVVNHF